MGEMLQPRLGARITRVFMALALAFAMAPNLAGVFAQPAYAYGVLDYASLQIEASAAGNDDAFTGAIPEGTKLYAHAYDYWDDDVIDPVASWQYQWLMSDTKSAGNSAYEPIEGQTSQCLDVTAELAQQLKGKYIRVKLTGDGQTLYAPTYPSSTPGPVELEGTFTLGWAFMVDSESAIGPAGGMKDASATTVGDTLKAVAMPPSKATTYLYTADGVTFTWQVGDSADGSFADTGITGDTFAVTADYAGKYLRVQASAGANTITTKAAFVNAEGVVQLQSVDISDPETNQIPAEGEPPLVLTATAYKGNDYGDRTEVTEGVTFTWSTAYDKYAAEGDWSVIEGVSGNTLTLDASFAGKYVRVKANAGANTVIVRESYMRGPFKTDGTLIYSAVLTANGTTTYNMAVGDTIGVIAYERTDSGSRGGEIAADKLTYRWQVADAGSDAFADLSGANATAASFVVGPELQGKCVRCIVDARAGSYTTRATNAIAAAGSVYVSRVDLTVDGKATSSSGIIKLGSIVEAKALDAQGGNLTDEPAVTWQWYASTSSHASDVTEADALKDATESSFKVTDASLIGKYLYAFADGGYGAVKSSASGKVTSENAVELWSVSVSGGTGGQIGVGDVLTASASKLVYVQGTTSTYSAPVAATDDVSYQWQYATTSSYSDSAFTDIEGATAPTYTITEDMIGKYLRVKVTSSNVAVSTRSNMGDAGQSVAPLGPVRAEAGAIEIVDIALTSSMAESMWVGATVTPAALYDKGSGVWDAVPKEAKVTYTWQVADSASGPFANISSEAFPKSSVNTTGELNVGPDLQGKYVRVQASALMNTKSSLVWQVLPEGVYDLLRVTFGDSQFYTGDTLYTNLQAKTLDYVNEASLGTKVPFDNPYVSYQWYSTKDEPVKDGDSLDFSGATWTPVEGATEADLTLPESVADSYVRVVATSSKEGLSTSVERITSKKVLSSLSLESAALTLDQHLFHPHPVYGEKTNVNEIVSERLKYYGYEGITVKTKRIVFSMDDANAHRGVSTADDETNGDVTFFSYDNALAHETHSFTSQRQVTVYFEFTRGDETPAEYKATIDIPWDQEKARALLEAEGSELALGFAEGDSAESVTQNVTLPCKSGNVWVTWQSSNEKAFEIAGEAAYLDFTGIPHRGGTDQQVTLTATLEGKLIDTWDFSIEDLVLTKEIPIVVKADTHVVDETQAALNKAINAHFSYDTVKERNTEADIDKDALTTDLSLPQRRALFADSGLNSDDFTVEYTTDDEQSLEVYGYRTYTRRPLPGKDAAVANLTLTVTSRKIPGVSFVKTLTYMIPALDEAEVDADLAYLQEVEDNIFAAYSEGKQEKGAVTSNLHSFQRAYFDDEGTLKWKYADSDKAANKYLIGFTPQTVSDNPKSDAAYSNFVSSHEGIVASSTLYVTRPLRDTGVSITCCLKSDRFGEYYTRYAADPECSEALKEKFQKLSRYLVSCQFTVKGTSVSEKDRVELESAADDALEAVADIATSADGSDVLANKQWVDAALMQELEDAAAYAKAVAAKEDVTAPELAAASERLAAALSAVDEAKQPGARAFADEDARAQAKAAADAAADALKGIYSSADGTDVASAAKWATPEAIDALEAAAAKVSALAAADVPADELAAALDELAVANEALKDATKQGTKDAGVAESKQAEQLAAQLEEANKTIQQLAERMAASDSAMAALVQQMATGFDAIQTTLAANAGARPVVTSVTVNVPKVTSAAVSEAIEAAGGVPGTITTITLGAKVKQIGPKAFAKCKKAKALIVKTKKLKKAKGALKGSAVKSVQVKLKSKKAGKKTAKKLKKVFAKKKCGKKVKVTYSWTSAA